MRGQVTDVLANTCPGLLASERQLRAAEAASHREELVGLAKTTPAAWPPALRDAAHRQEEAAVEVWPLPMPQ